MDLPLDVRAIAAIAVCIASLLVFPARLARRWVGGVGSPRTEFPGPSGYPFFGIILQMQTGHARTLAQWTKQYGDIFRVSLGNRPAIILNTREAVEKTLVGRQGVAFQSRPEFDLWHGAFSKAFDPNAPSTLGTMKYDKNVTRYRRLLHQETNAVKLPSYNHFYSRRFFRLLCLLAEGSSRNTSCDLGYHLWTTTIGISADQLVGQSLDEATTRLIADVNIRILRQRSLGAPFHDYIPLVRFAERVISGISSPLLPLFRLLHISAWLESFTRPELHAEELRRTEVEYCQVLLRGLHQRLDSGDTTPSVLGDMFRRLSDPLTRKEELMFVTTLAGSGMAAGTTLVWLMGKLAASPEMQERAVSAIKDVYGDDVPDPFDTDTVEYIKALGMEAGRFWSSIRLGFPRETPQDVIVDGFDIPKGTLVVYNSFQINRDPERYDFPEEFKPERWMAGHYGRTDVVGTKKGVPHLTHGAGHRMCMGITSVNKMLYGTLVLLLHFFKLERTPLSEAAKAEVFPSFRATREASSEMHPEDDQISTCDAQALPGYVGIKLTPRNPDALARWLAEGHRGLDQFDCPRPT